MEVLHGMSKDDVEYAMITYGWFQLPPSEALAIADQLFAIGVERKSWRYQDV